MKIAVTYDNGNIFQHFGRTENFKVYDVEDNKVVSSEVVSSNGAGHGALAGRLVEEGVDVLICGGMGQGAQSALFAAGITVFTGAVGSADEAVEKYLKGELESEGVNCDHHHGEDHECGEHGCGSHDDHGCGGCGGCGGGGEIIYEGKNAGKTVKVHYTGTFNDGRVFDTSYDRGEPLVFVSGTGMMIPGFDKAVVDMEPGEVKEVHLMPEEAYGPSDPDAIFTVEEKMVPGSEDLKEGDQIYMALDPNMPFLVRVVSHADGMITFDANPEMAGKELNFKIELVEVL